MDKMGDGALPLSARIPRWLGVEVELLAVESLSYAFWVALINMHRKRGALFNTKTSLWVSIDFQTIQG